MSVRPRLLIVNPNTSDSVTRWLAEEAERVARGRVRIAAVSAPSYLAAIETPKHIIQVAGVVADTIEADAGADAAIIGAFADPGLTEARARVSIPVVGLGEAGLRAAAKSGRFSIVTAGQAIRTALQDRIRLLGLQDRLVQIRILPMTIPDVIADREAHLGAIVEAIRACSGEAVLLGGAPLAGLGPRMTEETGVTVLDGVEASVVAAMRVLGSGV